MRTFVGLLSLLLCACTVSGDPGSSETNSATPDEEVVLERVESEEETFRVVKTLGGLEHAWGMDWLPDGRMLVTERPGRMLLVDEEGTTELSNVPAVWAKNQGGLLDVRVAPDYEETGWIYFTYSKQEGDTGGTVLSRAKLDGTSLTDVEELYRQTPFLEPDYHFGSRVAIPRRWHPGRLDGRARTAAQAYRRHPHTHHVGRHDGPPQHGRVGAGGQPLRGKR
jgi:Glucose/sorbosone dehydrogenases